MKKRVTMWLSEEAVETLRRLAEEAGVSQAAIVEMALRGKLPAAPRPSRSQPKADPGKA